MPRLDMPASDPSAGRSHERALEWTFKRNCSASPKQAAMLLGSVALVSLTIATMFALSGAWWVLFFSVLEVAALVVAFVVYARHAGDYERVVVTPDAVIIELNSGSRYTTEQIHPAMARVDFPCTLPEARGGGPLIGLASGYRVIGVGRHVPKHDRERLAREIRRELQRAVRYVGG
jgi:uncharacterized membrane protein